MNHTRRATLLYRTLILELEVQRSMNDPELRPSFTQEELLIAENAVDHLLRRAEEAYENAGKPSMPEREVCLRLIGNYTAN